MSDSPGYRVFMTGEVLEIILFFADRKSVLNAMTSCQHGFVDGRPSTGALAKRTCS